MTAIRPPDRYNLVADIGGTNTRVALADGPDILTDSVRRFRNADHASLEAVLTHYIATEGDVACHAASVAIAGPVRDGRGTLTNLNWTIDTETLARATKAEFAAVLNDLEAQGHAIGRISRDDLHTVMSGPAAAPTASSLVIGVGTGFNVAPVHHLGDRRLVVASEAGHETLPIRTEKELRLVKFVEAAHGFASVEDVLSGRGLCRLYAWLSTEAGEPREADGKAIMENCAAGTDPWAEAAVRQFVQLLGSVAGNQALNHLPFGGIYLAGGVARAMAPYFDPFGFADAFRAKGRFGSFLHAFSVHVIEDDFAALTGSAAHLAQVSHAMAEVS